MRVVPLGLIDAGIRLADAVRVAEPHANAASGTGIARDAEGGRDARAESEPRLQFGSVEEAFASMPGGLQTEARDCPMKPSSRMSAVALDC